MSYDPGELKEERRGIVKWLLDVALCRSKDDDDEAGEKIHRIGTINRLLGPND
jgi:hypothetical protein